MQTVVFCTLRRVD